MAKPSTPAPPPDALSTTPAPSGLALIQDVIASITTADEDPTERMAQFILSNPPEKWDELWAGLPSIRDYVGGTITVNAIRARESDFEGPVGVYLILDAVNHANGSYDLISCSSQMCMVQLLALHKSGRLPATVEVVQKEKKTRRGFQPIHLRYVGSAAGAPLGDPGAVVASQ